MANTALFYPHLYPTKRSLKLAALCWDSVYTLTPSSAVPPPPSQLAELDDALGGVLRTEDFAHASQSYELQEEFARWVDARADELGASAQLADREFPDLVALFSGKLGFGAPGFARLSEMGLVRRAWESVERRIPSWQRSEFEERDFESPYSGPTDEESRQYEPYSKLKERAASEDEPAKRAELEREATSYYESHLVSVEDGYDRVWIPEIVALHYLSLCAAHVAEDDNRDLVASDETFTDAVFNDARAYGGRVSTATVEALLPVGLDELDAARVAELRQELRLERRSHMTDVSDFVSEFERIASVGEWQRLERDAVEQAQLAEAGVRGAARRARIDLAREAVSISLTPPAVASTIASLLGVGLFVPAGIALALSLVGAQAYLRYREGSDPSPERWSYAVKLGRRLEGI